MIASPRLGTLSCGKVDTVTKERGTTFGWLLRQHRTAAGLTQEELAERAGLSERAISDLERGARTKPWPDTVALLAGALRLETDQREALERAVMRSRKTDLEPYLRMGPTPLPADLTRLLGRERDEAAVAHLLRRDDVRLLTLTGPGGIGKTRLALRVGRTEAPRYPDGVRFVPLAPLRRAEHVAPAIALALGLEEVRGEPLVQTLRRRAGKRHGSR